jgi:GNAT superfamily N-acetyltransferase
MRKGMKINYETRIPDLVIRFASKNDIPLILKFIKKLAVYEKLEHQVSANTVLLKKTLFGKRKVAEVIIAEYHNTPVGFSLFFHNFSTFLGKPGLYIEDVFVDEKMRGKGIGNEMLSFLARLAIERGCGRMEWWVLDWNEPAIRFYRKLGAQAMDGWTVYRLNADQMHILADY